MTPKTEFRVVEVLEEEKHLFPLFEKEFESSLVTEQTWFLMVPSTYEMLKARLVMRLLRSITCPMYIRHVKQEKTDEW